MKSIKIQDLRKVVLIKKALYQGISLKTAVFNNKLTLKDYQRITRVIKSMEAK